MCVCVCMCVVRRKHKPASVLAIACIDIGVHLGVHESHFFLVCMRVSVGLDDS